MLKYEDWLQQNDLWLSTNVQSLEQQVAKYRRTKKALNAKQRVVCKFFLKYTCIIIYVVPVLIGQQEGHLASYKHCHLLFLAQHDRVVAACCLQVRKAVTIRRRMLL